jgi:hypothetical protein
MSLVHFAAAVGTYRSLPLRLHIAIGAVTCVAKMMLMLVASLGLFSDNSSFPVLIIPDSQLEGIGT